VPAASLKGEHGLRRKSSVWKHFTKEYQADDGGFYVKCVLCAKEIAYCKSTSNLVKHVRMIHNKVYIQDLQSGEFVPVSEEPQSTILNHKVLCSQSTPPLSFTPHVC
jgi:hypothetical protein